MHATPVSHVSIRLARQSSSPAAAGRRTYFDSRWYRRVDGGRQRESISLQVIAAIAAVFLLAGLWTPIAGGIVTLSELWIILTGADDPRSTILLATLGTALAFLGPGALSVDARLFGRKRLDV